MNAPVPLRPRSSASDQLLTDGTSEDALARKFVEEYAGKLRYCHTLGKWLEFDGAIWRQDRKRRAFDYVRHCIREQAPGAKFGKAAVASGVEQFAKADKAMSAWAGDWDPDPYLLGTPVAPIDLKSGTTLPPDPAYMLTRATSVVPEQGEPTLWLEFLRQATGGDADLVRFLQQVCGYALTADTCEHALFFIHGPGGNGKGVFLNTFTRILGDYAATSPMETFIASRNDRHTTELAALAGARLVTASETDKGRAWAESRIKQMTGGDPITARFMRQDNFTFVPQFKLVIIGNHEPVLHNVDHAMRRRFNIIPFKHKPERIDRTLEQRLRAEHGRILQWMIEGCLDWQRNGLVRPTSVTDQTEQYFEEQDLLGQFVADRCEVDATYFERTGLLFGAWKKYAHAAGEDAGSQKAFGAELRKRGSFRPDRLPGGDRPRIYCGLRLIAADELPIRDGTHHQANADQQDDNDDLPV
jgi:putative DNA primase/helicase